MASRNPILVASLTVILLLAMPGIASPLGPARAGGAGQGHAGVTVPVRLGGLSGKPTLHLQSGGWRLHADGPIAGRGPMTVQADGNVVTIIAGTPKGHPSPAHRFQRLQLVSDPDRLVMTADPAQPGRHFDVPVTVSAQDGKLVAVAQIPEERYVAGVVTGEMTPTAPPQALRAQAILARTFLYQSRHRHQSDGAWVCDQSHCQVWRPEVPPAITAAVAACPGLVVVSPNGQLVPVYYHADCGGSTVPVHLVYGGSPLSHLGGIRDADCQKAPGWQANVPLTEAADALRKAGLIGPGPVTGLQVSDQTATGWPVSLRIEGSVPRTISAYQAWLAFGAAWGWGKLPGLHFHVQQTGATLTISGRGIGHGIGLCQRGAWRMAARGKTAETILATYFPGTKVGRP